MTHRRQRSQRAAQARRGMANAKQAAYTDVTTDRAPKDCSAAGVEPVSRVDAVADRALEERAWRAVWNTP